jgi:hypothetical protein
MILVDLNQVIIASLMVSMSKSEKKNLNEDLIRHLVLRSLASYLRKFRPTYGEMVVCCDSRNYWRKEVFPNYKANRKEDRKKSDLDWPLIFDTINKIRDELKENLPHKVLEINGAEADDIIGTLTAKYSSTQDILILSSDKDFVQLQRYKNVNQFSPAAKSYLTTDDPKAFLREHIIQGDKGDGVPNILSADDCLVNKVRQGSINKKKLAEWVTMTPDAYCDDLMMERYQRNQRMVDLLYTPEGIQTAINLEYDTVGVGTKTKMFAYFMENNLSNLMEELEDF